MAISSAGILLYQRKGALVEVLLVHPGGPFWARKDLHAWSIPKGEFASGESPWVAAQREFREETGQKVTGPAMPLTPHKQSGRKVIHVWAVEQWIDPARVFSNEFELEWPPHSRTMQKFPEVDQAAWFELTVALQKIHEGQIPILKELGQKLAGGALA